MFHFLRIKKRFFQILFVGCIPLLLGHCAQQGGKVVSSGRDGIPVQFHYRNSEAKTVCVAGSFNQWSPQSHCMTRENDRWSLCLFLPSGRHSYVYVIDKTAWQADPGALLDEDNGFGGKNSVLIVE